MNASPDCAQSADGGVPDPYSLAPNQLGEFDLNSVFFFRLAQSIWAPYWKCRAKCKRSSDAYCNAQEIVKGRAHVERMRGHLLKHA